MPIYITVTQMKVIVMRIRTTLEFSPQQPMRLTLISAMMKIVMVVVTAVMMMLKTTQTREIMMKSNLTPLYLITLF